MNIWLLRLTWATLPVTAGPAAADALSGWRVAPRTTAEVLLWLAWAASLFATLVPRPQGLTLVRTTAPLAFLAAVLTITADETSTLAAAVAIATTAIAWVVAALPGVGCTFAQGAAYGEEERFPLKVPPALFLGPLPLAVLVAGAGATAGPLLLADERWIAGGVALVVGAPATYAVVRLLHALSRRWVVLVPAGLVVADPLTLSDPVLFTREHVQRLDALPTRAGVSDPILDLRLGAVTGSVLLTLDQQAELGIRKRNATELTNAPALAFTPVARRVVLEHAGRRRLRVTTRS